MNIYLYVHIVVIVVQYRNVVHQAGNQGSIVYILLWSRASKANFSLTLLTLLSFTIYAISFTILSYNFNIINIKLILKFTYTWLLHKLVFLSTSSAYIFGTRARWKAYASVLIKAKENFRVHFACVVRYQFQMIDK